MKKTKAQDFLRYAMFLAAILSVPLLFNSCEEDDPEPAEDPVASFQYEISEENYLEVSFSNFSQNAETYSWAFGDGETSTEENPVHTYAEAGNYDVVLSAVNADGVSADFSQTIEIKDPNSAIVLLAGEISKTWKLYRNETSMGVGPDAAGARSWWSLENDGSRPCVYQHEFTFNRDGSFLFDHNGIFWGEEAVFGEGLAATCFEAVASNMVNSEGADVSAWLEPTHAFEYEPSTNTVTLNGNGAWMGLPQLGTNGESIVPEASKSFTISIEEFEGYDLMVVSYAYAEAYWDFTYVNYSDPSLEPEVVTEAEPFGEDLEDITPDEIFITFASKDAADMATIDTVPSGSSVIFGVDDPADPTADKVGEFIRTEGVDYQELQFRTTPDPKDIQFDNFTNVKIDVFVPDDTDFTTLARHMVFGFADQSQTEEWWGSPVQFVIEGEDLVVGAWQTYTFNLEADVKDRTDLDMIYLGLGGGGHGAAGTFYVRNLMFE